MTVATARARSLNNSGELIPDGDQITFTITNPQAALRAFDSTTPVLADVTRVLETLIGDLDTAGIPKAV